MTNSVQSETKSKKKHTDEETKKQHPPPPHITLSGMHTQEQKECISILRSSSFRYTIGTHDWNPAFTHVITPSMRRNQKCLCALASGAWILRPEFLRAFSTKESSALHEEEYEISDGDPSSGINEGICKFWRQSPQRPFQGLLCGLHRIPPSSTPSRKDIRSVYVEERRPPLHPCHMMNNIHTCAGQFSKQAMREYAPNQTSSP